MKKRSFYVALGIPRGADPDAIRLAYRKVVTRYRDVADRIEAQRQGEKASPSFAVCRSYSERRHTGLFDEPDAIDLRGETAVDRFFGGVIPEVVTPTAKRSGKDLFVELRLSEAEARRGGLFAVHIPVVRSCPRCAEEDEARRLVCTLCRGTRRVTENRSVDVLSPPGVEHGHRASVPMEDVGMDRTDLIISVLVGPATDH